jgi:transcriptional regulator with XRE-family HTH domain
MLSTDELKRRLDAARTLRGLKQTDLAGQFVEWGFGKEDIGRIERGNLTLTRARRVALAEILQVPEAWFEDEQLKLVPASRDEILDVLRDMHELLRQNASNLEQATAQSVAVRTMTTQRLTAAIEDLRAEVSQLREAAPPPAPGGALGRDAEDSRPSDADRRRTERRQEPDGR